MCVALRWRPMHISSVQFSSPVVSDSLRPHELQHARPPCPSPTPGVHSNSCPSSWWCHPTISSSVLLLPLSIFPSFWVFSYESVLCVRWLKYWSFSFSISSSNEYSGLISFRIDSLDLLAVHAYRYGLILVLHNMHPWLFFLLGCLWVSMGSLRVGHNWATSLSLFTFMHWRRKWQPTPVFLPGESQGQQSLVDCHLWGCTESDTTKVT